MLTVYLPIAEKMARKHGRGLPEDVTDTIALDCLVKCWKTFDPTRGSGEGGTPFRRWLYQHIWQACEKRRLRRPLPVLQSLDKLEQAIPYGKEEDGSEDKIGALLMALQDLPPLTDVEEAVLFDNLMVPPQQIKVTLRVIAKQYNLALVTVKRIRRRLLGILKENIQRVP